MFTDKLTLAIAESAKKCMDEELKGNQHKIDANKNGKIDAQDFKILRKEESEGSHGYIAFSHDGKRHELYANTSYEAKQKAVKHFNPPKSKQHLVTVHLAQKDGKDVTHIATEAVQEGAIDDLKDRQAAAREANPYGSKDKKEPTVRKVQGSQYGGSKQKHEPEKEVDESVDMGQADRTLRAKNSSTSNTYHVKDKANKIVSSHDNQASAMRNAMKNDDYRVVKEQEELKESKAHIEQHLANKDINAKVTGNVVKVHSSDVASAKKHVKMAGYKDHKVVGGLNEEKMSDEDMAERERIVKGMKKNLKGFKQRYGERAKEVMYATATKQAMKEEVEQIDELSKDTLKSYREKAHVDMINSAGKAIGAIHKKDKPTEIDSRFTWEKRIRGVNAADKKLKKEEVEQIDEISKKTLGSYVKKAAYNAQIHAMAMKDIEHEKGGYTTDSLRHDLKRTNRRAGIVKAVNRLTKEEVTNDGFKAELEDNKAKAAGTKKQADVHKASVQSVKQESFSEKLSMLKEGVRSFLKGRNDE